MRFLGGNDCRMAGRWQEVPDISSVLALLLVQQSQLILEENRNHSWWRKSRNNWKPVDPVVGDPV